MNLSNRIGKIEQAVGDFTGPCAGCGSSGETPPRVVEITGDAPLAHCCICGALLDDDGQPFGPPRAKLKIVRRSQGKGDPRWITT